MTIKSIAIIGMGYIGLPLALRFCAAGINVLALDVDTTRIEALNRGRSYLMHVKDKSIARQLRNKRLVASIDFSAISEVQAIILCVPTPLNKNREPDISYIVESGKSIAPYLKKGSLVVLESTTYPGTTEGELKEVLEKGSHMKAGRDFHLAYSPERTDPTAPESWTTPRVIGGHGKAAVKAAMEMYGHVTRSLVPVSSCRVAEATKLLENIYRNVNVALVNELKVVYASMGINIWEVIAAATTKSFGYTPFFPGPGLGGHCIPVDPFYLTWKAREFNQHTRLIEVAGEINSEMPRYVLRRVAEALNASRKAIKGSKVLILGVAYKPNVDDDRESPCFPLMNLLKERGAKVSFYDPHLPVILRSRKLSPWGGKKSIKWSRRAIAAYDAVVIVCDHSCVNYAQLGEWSQCIVDARNAMAKASITSEKVWLA